MKRVVGIAVVVAMAACGVAPAAPWPAVNIASSAGSGDFGRWKIDGFGLPSFSYRIDEQRSRLARQPELAGATDAAHLLGNDHVIADAYNHGYVQLWSQDRRYEWANRYDAADGHFAGGYGYLRVGARVVSTLYDDRPAGARSTRVFGTGYFERATRLPGVRVDEYVYAPFGDDAVLLHDVTITNTSARARRMDWFEYWDVNPYDEATKTVVATGAARWLPGLRALTVPQLATAADRRPLMIFAASLRGPVAGHAASADAFFGPEPARRRADPGAVAAGRLTGGLAAANDSGAPGHAMFAFQAPLNVPAHGSVTLRYAYGAVHAAAIPGLVRRYSRATAPLQTSEGRWRAWLPQVQFGSGRSWLSRELQWDAYTLRSGASYEDCRGRHVISQGGYYQYDLGFQGAFRDPLQHLLPLIYADPPLARDVLLYSAQEQPHGGQVPYAMSELCQKFKFGNADDMDLWLLWAAAEYGLGTRDLGLFDAGVTFTGGGSATLWQHLKLAFAHQQSLLGPHGGYRALDTGDWSDLSTSLLGMTESTLVTAQVAYVYPRLAELAEARGDSGFARALRAAGAVALRTTRAQWTRRGWYARGYAGDRRLGTGAIFGEPQPWAILAGAPAPAQERTLIDNIRRYLTGIGAPAVVHGPTPIGSAQSPAAADPAVTERTHPPGGLGAGAAVFPGGSWYAINGWLTWALATLGDRLPGARSDAFDEFLRGTLTAHAQAYPGHWDGTISVDDVCHAFYSPTPAECGAGLTTGFEGQIMHQPAWSLFDAVRLAGVEPTAGGYRIDPQLPFRTFSLALPNVGVGYSPGLARGYLVSSFAARPAMQVRAPGPGRWQVRVDGRVVASRSRGALLVFSLPVRAGRRTGWVVARGGGRGAIRRVDDRPWARNQPQRPASNPGHIAQARRSSACLRRPRQRRGAQHRHKTPRCPN